MGRGPVTMRLLIGAFVSALLLDATIAPGLRTALGAVFVLVGWAVAGVVTGIVLRHRGPARWATTAMAAFAVQVSIVLVFGLGDPRILLDGSPITLRHVMLSGLLAAPFGPLGAYVARPPPSRQDTASTAP